MKLRRWSRGILATVRGGGHIEHFAPLYNSESPTQVIVTSNKKCSHDNFKTNVYIQQVAMILIAFLCEVLKDIKPELWSRMYLSYDNMYFFSMFYILYDIQLSSGAMLTA